MSRPAPLTDADVKRMNEAELRDAIADTWGHINRLEDDNDALSGEMEAYLAAAAWATALVLAFLVGFFTAWLQFSA